jgi:hypothetical protein
MPTISDVLAKVRSSGRVTADDALAMRRAVYGGDARISEREMEDLFEIDEVAVSAAPEWRMLLVEAGTDYIVNQVPPEGYIDAANANWLVERISRDGKVNTATELELLVKVLEAAQSSPQALVAFALRQVSAAVIDGDGPLADGSKFEPGRINRAEVALLRRILYAYGGASGVAITRAEAEVLFDINDATAGAKNDPAWTDLFSKAIANCVMAASGYQVPPREVALAREAWLDSASGGIGSFFSQIAAGGLKGIIKAYTDQPGEADWAARNARFEAEVKANAVGTEDEAKWLADRIGRDGKVSETEKALLRFIHQEAPHIHPALAKLIKAA